MATAAFSRAARVPLVGNVLRNPYQLYVTVFILSLLFPVSTKIGNLVMQPYRIVLLLLFIPMLATLMSGKCGKVNRIDGLMIGCTLWSILSLAMNHKIAQIFDSAGILGVEFFGAYLLARVGIRSSEDFQRLVKLLLLITAILLPFAAIEGVTKDPILLKILPGSHTPVNAGVRLNLRRAQSVFAHPIHFGVFVSSMLGIGWYVGALGRPVARRIRIAVMVFLATFFSLSTGALIALSSQFYTIIYDNAARRVRRQWRTFAILLISGYVIIDMLSNRTPFDVLVDYLSFNQGSAYNRILIWKYGMENVWDNPTFGLGYRDWVRPSWMHSGSADNFWLLTAMRYGIPSFLFLAAALVVTITRLSWAPLTDPLDRACRAGILVTMAGLIVAGGTVHYWNSMLSFVTFLLFSGIYLTRPEGRVVPAATAEPAVRTRPRVFLGAPPERDPAAAPGRRTPLLR